MNGAARTSAGREKKNGNDVALDANTKEKNCMKTSVHSGHPLTHSLAQLVSPVCVCATTAYVAMG